MKRKVLIVSLIILLVVGGILIVFMNSNYYYSKKLIVAIEKEDIATVQNIIEKKPTCINTYPAITSKWWQSAMDWRVYYPLNQACATGNIELIELLIKNGADVNCNDGLTPLSVTYHSKVDNWYNISLILIENGASLDYVTEYSGGKSSVLQDIVHVRSGAALPRYKPESEEEVIEAFNYALENIDHNNVNWMRVLQHSVTNNRIEIVKFLLDNGYCQVNDNSSDGMTALMFASRESTTEMVQLLLDYGADKTILCDEGKTALDYAIEIGRNEEIIALLSN